MKPILFTIGPFHVFAFGFFLSLAFLFSTFIIWKYGKEELLEEELLDTFVYTSLVSLFSARAFYIIFHFQEFQRGILSYLVFRQAPGLSFLGATLGGVIFLFFYTKRKKLDFSKVADIFSLAAALGFSLASLGEFLGGASYGRITKLPWGVRVAGLPGVRHPVELYQSVILFILFICLSYLYRRFGHMKISGILAMFFIILSSFVVFLLEFLKEGSVYLYNSLTINQAIALGIIVVTIFPLTKKVKILFGQKSINK